MKSKSNRSRIRIPKKGAKTKSSGKQKVKKLDNSRPVFITSAFLVALIVLMIGSMLGIPGNQYRVLSEADLVAELHMLEGMNTYPNNKVINPSQFPKTLGIYMNNGQTLTEVYHCSDVCPEYGRIIVIFENVTQSECQQVGGRAFFDPAWGSYVACVPSVDSHSSLG